jgi:hypothetical protein
MDVLFKLILYVVCVGYSIFKAYKLGFECGEDKGRRDMLIEITGEFPKTETKITIDMEI